MISERIFRLVLVLLLAFGSSVAVRNGLEDKLAEDERFWGRELQAVSSFPIVVIPVVPPGTTLPPTQPCDLRITIECETGEGIECDMYIPTGACGLITQEFVYIFQNSGATPFSIDSYEIERTGQPSTTVNFDASLEPGGTARAFENIEFDSCVPSVTTVTAVGNPGGCVGTDTLSYTPSTRRLTRDMAIAATAATEINAEKEVGVAVVNENLARRRRRTKYTRGGAQKE